MLDVSAADNSIPRDAVNDAASNILINNFLRNHIDLPLRPSFMDSHVGPGQNVLIVTATNDSGSVGTLNGVSVSVPSYSSPISAPPVVTPTSADIAPGGQKDYQVQFSIASDAQSGTQGSLSYTVSVSNPNNYPRVQNATVGFKIDATPPRVAESSNTACITNIRRGKNDTCRWKHVPIHNGTGRRDIRLPRRTPSSRRLRIIGAY